MQTVAIIVSLAFTAVAVVLTTRAVQSMVATMRIGQPAVGRTDQPVARTVTMFKETFLHTRMLQWTVVGIMHWFVYLAFIILSSAVFAGYFQLFDPQFALPIIGHFFLFEWVSEVIGLLSTVGIIYLIIYRQKNHPRSQGRQSRFFGSSMWQAYFVEAMVLLEGGAILFIRGAEYNLGQAQGETDKYSGFHFPISQFFGNLYPTGADSIGTLENIIITIAMFKILLAMIWLIVISANLTMGVAWHRFTAWPNIWFKRESSGRTALGAVKPLTSAGKAITLDDIDDLDEDSTLGVGAIEDYSWKGLLDFTTCTECGRCQSQCPAWNTEKPLSPKLLITAMRDHAYAKAPYLQADEADRAALLEGNDTLQKEVDRPLVGDTGDDWFYNPESGAAVIDADVLWNCTSCGACVQQCPVDIEHLDHIIDMRRYAVLVESNFPSELNGLFKGLENKGNPWNMSPSARMDWAKGLDFEVKVVGADPELGGIESLDEVEWLFWVGCAGAYEDRAKKTTRAVAELLDMAGVSFGVLGNGETCTGDPARRAGNEFVFQGLAQQNVEVMTQAKAKKVVSTCAHCFNTLKNEYQDFGIELEVVHHTQLLNRLVREGKLTPVKDGEGAHKRSITYHDPCYIGRHNGVYTPPRELLQILPGAEFVEMERNSERSFCCGAGGARMWMEENIGERININRTVEAVGTGADQIAVGCPFCRVMLSDGLTAQQAKGEAREEVEVLDVAQMLLAAVKGEVATKVKPGGAATAPAASASAAPAATQDVATKAEPEAGDETITADTITETADAGPLAKASGGSSLFDTPEAQAPAATADPAASVSDEAEAASRSAASAPAEPAATQSPSTQSSGGSLFDLGGDEAPAARAAEPEPTAKAQPAATPAKTEPTADLGTSGSLFDLGGDEAPPAPAAEPEPTAKAQPAATPAKTEPTADLGTSGSLFDLSAAEAPATKAAPAAPAEVEADITVETEATPAVEAAPVAKATPTPTPTAPAAPAVDLGSGGSLFDIASPEPVAAPATKADPTPVTAEPEPKPEPKVTKAEVAPEVPAATTTTEAPAAQPVAEIPEGGSLFDIVVPEPSAPTSPATITSAAAPQAEDHDEAKVHAEVETEEPEGATGSDQATPAQPATRLSAGAALSAAATQVASTDPGASAAEPTSPLMAEPMAEAEPEPEAADPAAVTEPEAPTEDEPQIEKATPVSSGEAHQPKTDVDISGSLFDL